MKALRHAGMTLIELMVALAVFAVLGTLSYRGTAQMLDSRHAVEQELERWREIGRALYIVETELLQIAAPPAQPGSRRAPALQLIGHGEETRLAFLGLSAGSGVEQVAFHYGAGRLAWERRPDALPDTATESDLLLERVSGVRWRFLDARGWSDTWAPRPAPAPVLPRAIRLELDLADIGTVSRIYALR